MIQLKNNTKTNSRIGYVVSIDSRDPQSFVYTTPNATKAIGVVIESVPYRKLCKIATTGDTARVYVASNTNKNDIIRLGKTGDNISLGASKVAGSGDAPYLKIGDALSSGKGLISMVLDLQYTASSSCAGGISIPSVFPYTIKDTDTLIICDSAVAVTVNLPKATGSSRKIEIKSIGLGAVTVEADGAETIDNALNQVLTQWDCMDIIDYVIGNWVIT